MIANYLPEAVSQFADQIDIHPVCSCSQHTSHAAGSKLQIAVKPIFDLFLISKRGQFRFRIFIKTGAGKPLLITVFNFFI